MERGPKTFFIVFTPILSNLTNVFKISSSIRPINWNGRFKGKNIFRNCLFRWAISWIIILWVSIERSYWSSGMNWLFLIKCDWNLIKTGSWTIFFPFRSVVIQNGQKSKWNIRFWRSKPFHALVSKNILVSMEMTPEMTGLQNSTHLPFPTSLVEI